MSWLTLAHVKAAKGITDTSQDDAITALLSTAEDFVAQQLPRFTARQVFTEQHSGQGVPLIVLNRRPVCGVASLKDSLSRDWDNTDDIDPGSYSVDPKSGVLELDGADVHFNVGPGGGSFQCGNRNVRVVYVAGYGLRDDEPSPVDENDHEDFDEFPLPMDVVKYAADYVMACINTAGSDGLAGESFSAYSYTKASAILSEVFHTTIPGAKSTWDRWQDGTGAR